MSFFTSFYFQIFCDCTFMITFHFAPPLCILRCTTLVHFTLHHPCAFYVAPPLCILLCTTLVHFALHHPCAFCFAPPLCILLCTTFVHCRCTTLVHRDVPPCYIVQCTTLVHRDAPPLYIVMYHPCTSWCTTLLHRDV